jgi:hypothetical protein
MTTIPKPTLRPLDIVALSSRIDLPYRVLLLKNYSWPSALAPFAPWRDEDFHLSIDNYQLTILLVAA